MPRFFRPVVLALLHCVSCVAAAVPCADETKIYLVYFGANDCPPCVVWFRQELPKLQAAILPNGARFFVTTKLVNSAVPPAWFLPSEVRRCKAALDVAGNRVVGSPQIAIIWKGSVYDFVLGTRSAEDLVQSLWAIERGTPYPFPRCVRLGNDGACAGRE
jgi:hypothetical protein